MARRKSLNPFIRKNITLPPDFGPRLDRMRLHYGAASDSEVIRTALVDLERKMGFSPFPAIVAETKKKEPGKK